MFDMEHPHENVHASVPVAVRKFFGVRISKLAFLLAAVGSYAREHWDELRHVASVVGTVLCVGVRPGHWVRSVRTAFARQVVAIRFEPVAFVCAMASFVGISVV